MGQHPRFRQRAGTPLPRDGGSGGVGGGGGDSTGFNGEGAPKQAVVAVAPASVRVAGTHLPGVTSAGEIFLNSFLCPNLTAVARGVTNQPRVARGGRLPLPSHPPSVAAAAGRGRRHPRAWGHQMVALPVVGFRGPLPPPSRTRALPVGGGAAAKAGATDLERSGGGGRAGSAARPHPSHPRLPVGLGVAGRRRSRGKARAV